MNNSQYVSLTGEIAHPEPLFLHLRSPEQECPSLKECMPEEYDRIVPRHRRPTPVAPAEITEILRNGGRFMVVPSTSGKNVYLKSDHPKWPHLGFVHEMIPSCLQTERVWSKSVPWNELSQCQLKLTTIDGLDYLVFLKDPTSYDRIVALDYRFVPVLNAIVVHYH